MKLSQGTAVLSSCRCYGARAFCSSPSRVRNPSRMAISDEKASGTPVQAAPKEAVEDLPIWVRRERERELQEKEGVKDLPWGLYLLGSVLTAIAAVGSIFEYIDGNAFFDVIQPDSPAWAPILLTLAITGFPTAGFLFFKGVSAFNAAAERQDKIDGY